MTSIPPELEKSTTSTVLPSTLNGTDDTTPSDDDSVYDYKFPYPILFIVLVWILLALAYVITRWRQKTKNVYIIPRVFVLCSPRTVQYHYELILRVGLPSWDFNPDKHDIDITIQGQQKNEVVPMTRLNTKTLLDDPLITSLSIVVYRLVEMPPLGGLILKHSGPFKSWVYAYDFTVIDLSTNKEQYYTINQYIGSLDKVMYLEEPNSATSVHYPIDDVPLPQWSVEDIFLFLYTVINAIMLIITMMPINCTYTDDIMSVFLAALGGGTLVFFLDWFLYYHLKWNQDRREYFNDYERHCLSPSENVWRIILAIVSTCIGACCIYYAVFITDWKSSIVWLLAVVNSCTFVIGIWNVARQAELGENIVALGLKVRGVDTVSIGMRYSDMVSDIHTKSGSTEDGSSTISAASKIARSFGPRSSIKSFGFDAITGQKSRKVLSRFQGSRLSATGATPNNQPDSQILQSSQTPIPRKQPLQQQQQVAPKKSPPKLVKTHQVPVNHVTNAIAAPQSSAHPKPESSHKKKETSKRKT